ncbi:hypothetical protein KP78_17760 [Jeotgalibacillus soli]|uniref:Uncharacterized protein n=2 Tax=Jeotgalibacillus soli TaxID=889306 RepID=A0A0C2VT67_9BACL|nr:hypothetical protein KP78_17760 [Jeotgalibacillus soli]
MAFDSYAFSIMKLAYRSICEAYAHMTMPAEGLSAAIVDQFPENFGRNEMPT